MNNSSKQGDANFQSGSHNEYEQFYQFNIGSLYILAIVIVMDINRAETSLKQTNQSSERGLWRDSDKSKSSAWITSTDYLPINGPFEFYR